MTIRIIDTHCHLSSSQYSRQVVQKILDKISANEIYVINVGYDRKTNEKVLSFTQNKNILGVSIGFHPNYAISTNQDDLDWMREKLRENQEKIIAIGEIGLDYYRGDQEDIELKKKQKEILVEQIKLAKKYSKPVIIHVRGKGAHKDLKKIIEEENLKRFLIHCYDQDLELMKDYAKNFSECYFSFSGVITFKNCQNFLLQAAKESEISRILVETDSPWLAPQNFRGQKNHPENVLYVLEKIANLKNIEKEKLAEIIFQNTLTFFNLEKVIFYGKKTSD